MRKSNSNSNAGTGGAHGAAVPALLRPFLLATTALLPLAAQAGHASLPARGLAIAPAGITHRLATAIAQAGSRLPNPPTGPRTTLRQAGLAAIVSPQAAGAGVIAARLEHAGPDKSGNFALDMNGDGLIALNVSRQMTTVQDGKQTLPALMTGTGTAVAQRGVVLLTAQQADRLVQALMSGGGARARGHAADAGGRVLAAGIGGDLEIDSARPVAGPGNGRATSGVTTRPQAAAAGRAVAATTTAFAPSAAPRAIGNNRLLPGRTVAGRSSQSTRASRSGAAAPLTVETGNTDIIDLRNQDCPTVNCVSYAVFFREASEGTFDVQNGNLTFVAAPDSTSARTINFETTYAAGTFAVAGNILIESGTNLTAAGIAASSAGSILVLGTLQSAGAVSLTAGINLAAGAGAVITEDESDRQRPQSPAGTIVADTLAIKAENGDVELDQPNNQIATLLASSATGSLTVADGAALQIGGNISATNVSLDVADGDVTETARTTVATSAAAGTLSIVSTTGSIILLGSTQAGTVLLSAGQDITETAPAAAAPTGSIVAGTFAAVAAGAINLSGTANSIATIAPALLPDGTSLTGLAAEGAVALTDALTLTLADAQVEGTSVDINVTGGQFNQAGGTLFDFGGGITVRAADGIYQQAGADQSLPLIFSEDGTVSLTALTGDIQILGSVQSVLGGAAARVAGAPQTGGLVSLTAVTGSVDEVVSQSATGSIVAGTLSVTAGGNVLLGSLAATPSANLVGTLAGGSAGGNFVLTDASPLSVAGDLTAPNVTLDAAGLQVAAGVTLGATGTPDAPGTLAIVSTGSLSLQGTVQAGTLLTDGGYNGAVLLSAGGPISELAADGRTPVGVILAGTLSGVAAGDMLLTGPGNLIASVAPGTVPGSNAALAGLQSSDGVTDLVDGQGLTLADTQVSGTAVTINVTAGQFNQASGALTDGGGGITIQAAGGIDQQIVDNQPPPLIASYGGAVALTALAGDIQIIGTVESIAGTAAGRAPAAPQSAGLVSLDAAAGSVDEALTGSLFAGTLSASASGNVFLGSLNATPSANLVDTLAGGSAGGNFVFTDASPLTVAANVTAADVTLSGAGLLVAPGVTVGATGGPGTSGTLAIVSTGSISLQGIVQAGTLSNDGTYTGDLLLSAGGPISETAANGPTPAGIILAGTLSGAADGEILLNNPANLIGTIAPGSVPVSNADLAGLQATGDPVALVDGQGLLLSGAQVSGTRVSLDITAGALTQSGGTVADAGGGISITAANGIVQTSGVIDSTGGNVRMGADIRITALDGDISIGGTIEATSGSIGDARSVTLDAVAGNVLEVASGGQAGTVIAGALSVTAGGNVDLGSVAEAAPVNQVGQLIFGSAGGNFILTDAIGLTVPGTVHAGPLANAGSTLLLLETGTSTATNTLTLSAGATLATAGGTIALRADQFALGGALDAGTGEVAFDVFTAGGTLATGTASFGGTSYTGNFGAFGFGALTTGTLVLGSLPGEAGRTGTLFIGTSVDCQGTLGLFSGGAIIEDTDPGTGAISAPDLFGAAGGDISLNSAGNFVGAIVAGPALVAAPGLVSTTGTLALRDSTSLALGTPQAGATLSGTAVTLSLLDANGAPTGTLTQTGGSITATGGGITLLAQQFSQTDAATVTTSAGPITIDAATSQAGASSIAAGAGDNPAAASVTVDGSLAQNASALTAGGDVLITGALSQTAAAITAGGSATVLGATASQTQASSITADGGIFLLLGDALADATARAPASGAAFSQDATSSLATATGPVVIDATAGDIDFAGLIQAGKPAGASPGTVALVAEAGSIHGAGSVQAGTLAASATGSALLTGANLVAAVDPVSIADPAEAYTLSLSGLAAGGALDLNDATSLVIGGGTTLSGASVTLNLAGPIGPPANLTQLGGAITATAGDLTLSTGNFTQQGGTDSATGQVTLNGLGDVIQAGGSSLAGVNGVTLTAAGTIDQRAGGTIASAAGNVGLYAASVSVAGAIDAGAALTAVGTSQVMEATGASMSGGQAVHVVAYTGDVTQQAGAVIDGGAITIDTPATLSLAGTLSAGRIELGATTPSAELLWNNNVIATGSSLSAAGAAALRTPIPVGTQDGLFVSTDSLIQTGETVITPLGGGRATVQISLAGGNGQAQFNAAPGTASGLFAPQAQLILALPGAAQATGNIDVAGLNILEAGPQGAASLTGLIGGTGGIDAASLGFTHARPAANYQFNGCEIELNGCVAALVDLETAALQLPVDDPVQDGQIAGGSDAAAAAERSASMVQQIVLRRREADKGDDDDALVLPNVAEQDY